MRALAQGGYTEAQIAARLFDPNVKIWSRFDVLDLHGRVLDTLTGDLEGVEGPGATITYNVDNDIRSQLRGRMFPVEVLRDQPFRRLLRPVFVLGMPDGGTCAWPLGEYVWTSPDRDVWPGDEWWDFTCADKTHLLDLGGPGRAGFTVTKGTFVTQAINLILRYAGFPADERVPNLDERAPKHFVYRLTMPWKIRKWQDQYVSAKAKAQVAPSTKPGVRPRPTAANVRYAKIARRLQGILATYTTETAPVTWLKIIYDLCAAVGLEFWFDYDGKPRVEPSRDLARATPDLVFSDGMVFTRVSTSTDYGEMANRVFVRPKSGSDLPIVEVDANSYMPWHPLSEARVGVYVDATIDDEFGTTPQAMVAQGKRRLFQSLGAYEVVRFESLAHPGLEPFDVIGLRVEGDAEFGSTARLHVRQHGFDLWGGTMPVEGRRVFVP